MKRTEKLKVFSSLCSLVFLGGCLDWCACMKQEKAATHEEKKDDSKFQPATTHQEHAAPTTHPVSTVTHPAPTAHPMPAAHAPAVVHPTPAAHPMPAVPAAPAPQPLPAAKAVLPPHPLPAPKLP